MSHRSSKGSFAINGVFSFGTVHIYRESIKESQGSRNVNVKHQGTHVTFLDLDIAIKYNIFIYKLFDRRCKFPFS